MRTCIHGYNVDIEPNEDREGVNCYISKGRFSASLSCLEDEGALFSVDGQIPVSNRSIDAIRLYAEKHGY